MLKFKDLTKFPSFYSERNSSLKSIKTKIVNISNNEEDVTINAVSNNHNVIIQIFKKQKNILNNPCKCICDCQSFKFEFAKMIFNSGSLYGDVIEIDEMPKKTNAFGIISGCKHIIHLSNIILSNITKINI